MKWAEKQKGFTIVELLIVVVVIAILAAITIVAYNGISGRAKDSAAKSDTANAIKSLEVFKVTNSRYPTTSTEAKLSTSGGNTLDYISYNAGEGFCVEYTNSNGSYYATNAMPAKVGVCDPITNLATNPSLETGNTGWAARWFGSGGSGTNAVSSAGAICGNVGWRKTWTVSGAYQDIGFQYSVPGVITPGVEYAFSVSARASFVTTHRAWVSWSNSSGSAISSDNMSVYYDATTPGQARDMTFRSIAPAGAVSAIVIWGPYPTMAGQPGYNNAIPVGATLDGDCVLVAISSRDAKYADGSTANWAWSGTANASTSSGPAY